MTPLSIDGSLIRAWAIEFNRAHRAASMNASVWRLRFAVAVAFGVLVFLAGRAFAETNADALSGKPDVVIDLATKEGVDLVKGQWRYSDTKITQVDFKAAGPDKQPTGKPIKTYDFTPHAGGADFDDSKWEKIDPTTLDARRSTGRLCFNWYRINITIPPRVNEVDLAGATAVFETSIDDYAEIWVDGEMSRALGQSGGSVVKGWNAPNRLIINRSVQPGQKIQLAVFGINGPLSNHPNNNTIYKYSPEGNSQLAAFREKSGYEGTDIAEYGQPGSNGLTFDREGRLTINQHGNRRVVRLESDGQLTVLADKFEGKRLNSPNDLVYRSDGTIYFTDPPFGLPKFFNDPRKELPFSGVFAAKDGKVTLVSKDLTGPNGLAFSPDEKFFYVDNWDDHKKIVMRYEVNPDGTLKNGKLFFNMTSAGTEDALDGMKVDKAGNLYVSGPGGLWILSPEGKHLGTIIAPKHPHNFAWGDADGKTLYICARSGLYRMKLNIEGIRP